jgi:hypothetical protein
LLISRRSSTSTLLRSTTRHASHREVNPRYGGVEVKGKEVLILELADQPNIMQRSAIWPTYLYKIFTSSLRLQIFYPPGFFLSSNLVQSTLFPRFVGSPLKNTASLYSLHLVDRGTEYEVVAGVSL